MSNQVYFLEHYVNNLVKIKKSNYLLHTMLLTSDLYLRYILHIKYKIIKLHIILRWNRAVNTV